MVNNECLAVTRPKSTTDQLQDDMARAFEKYASYIQYLAEGKLDGFLDSLKEEDNNLPDGLNDMQNRRGPFLLLHGLGRFCDTEQIEELFSECTVFVAAGFARM